MLDRLDDMREDLAHNDFADDVGGAKKGMEQHTELRRKILKVPVENIDNVGQRILQRYFLTSDILSINNFFTPDIFVCIIYSIHLLGYRVENVGTAMTRVIQAVILVLVI